MADYSMDVCVAQWGWHYAEPGECQHRDHGQPWLGPFERVTIPSDALDPHLSDSDPSDMTAEPELIDHYLAGAV